MILLDEGSLLDHLYTGLSARKHLLLLGVLYSGPQYTAEGKIVKIKVPTRCKRWVETEVPMNLGFVIKFSRILEFEPLLAALVGQPNST